MTDVKDLIKIRNTHVWIIQFCRTASWKLLWFYWVTSSCPMLDLNEQILMLRNMCGTSGKAIGIFKLCRKAAALG